MCFKKKKDIADKEYDEAIKKELIKAIQSVLYSYKKAPKDLMITIPMALSLNKLEESFKEYDISEYYRIL